MRILGEIARQWGVGSWRELIHQVQWDNFLDGNGNDSRREVVEESNFYMTGNEGVEIRAIEAKEIGACHFENIIRSAFDKGLRKEYVWHGQVFPVLNMVV